MKPKRLTRYLSSKIKEKIKTYNYQVVHGLAKVIFTNSFPYTYILGEQNE